MSNEYLFIALGIIAVCFASTFVIGAAMLSSMISLKEGVVDDISTDQHRPLGDLAGSENA